MSLLKRKKYLKLNINNFDYTNRKCTRFIWERKLDYHEIFKIATPFAAVKLANIFEVCKTRKMYAKDFYSVKLIFISKGHKLINMQVLIEYCSHETFSSSLLG